MLKVVLFFWIFLLNLWQYMNCEEVSVFFKGKQVSFDVNTDEKISRDQDIKKKLWYLDERLGFCSSNFQYLPIDDFVIGKLSLQNLKLGDTVRAQFGYVDLELNMTFTGSLLPDENALEIMNKLHDGRPITFRVDFPIAFHIPQLEGVFINGNEFCRTTVSVTTKKLVLDYTLQTVRNSLKVFNYNINIPNFLKAATCGLDDTEITSNGITPYIHGGTIVRRGEYPWLTAIYVKEIDGLSFVCGGSLLSSRIILTAAHCLSPNDWTDKKIIVHLGSYNLSDTNDSNVVVREIKDVTLHPEYKAELGFSDADLALLKMKEPVIFTKYIKPICLWSESSDETLIAHRIGVVAGWGTDENNHTLSAVPKKVRTTIVSYAECLRSSSVFSAITSSRTLCAGNRDDSGPCVGDSGGGLMINRNGRWMLRGVVSAGLISQKQCDLQQFTVYCDVAKHINWLDTKIGQQEQPTIGAIENVCGKIPVDAEARSQNPWLAAIYMKMTTGVAFYCTGVLISSRSILAPAHCVDRSDGDIAGAEFLRVYLGRYDLNNIQEDGVVGLEVDDVIRHPKYKFSAKIFYDSDILLLQLRTPVSFTQYIRPICLWNDQADPLRIIGETATLASWDVTLVYNETFTVPQLGEVNIVPMRECQAAGYNAGTTTRFLCTPRFGNNVDGVLMLQRNGRWYLRGLSSSNLFYIFIYSSRNFRVYSDIVDYLSWIQINMFS